VAWVRELAGNRNASLMARFSETRQFERRRLLADSVSKLKAWFFSLSPRAGRGQG
jgi:hypothetical protein